MRAVLDYQTQYTLGWWWGVCPGTYQYPIRYTQPDVYIRYPWVTPEGTAGAFSEDGFGVFHISKSTVDQGNLGLIISTGAGSAGGGIAVLLAGAGGILSLAVAGIVAVTGGIESWIVTTYVADSAGAAWKYFNNLGGSDNFNIWVDWKLGALPWMNGGFFYGIPYCYCLWYGDNYLGIDGI